MGDAMREVIERLSAQHRELAEMAANLGAMPMPMADGDPTEVWQALKAFERALLEHLDREGADFIPAPGRLGPSVTVVRSEHALLTAHSQAFFALREAADRLKEVTFEPTLAVFLDALRDRFRLEERTIYRYHTDADLVGAGSN
jgi:tRNA U34 5-methylaminomethyl-2-thiouridine-forming methyltransferase MnmC